MLVFKHPITLSLQDLLGLLQENQQWQHHQPVEDDVLSIGWKRKIFPWSSRQQSQHHWTCVY